MNDEKMMEPGKLETFAIVEVMGHNRYAGFVQQVPMGGAAMIRVDVPEIPAYEEDRDEWDSKTGGYTKRKHQIPAMPAFTKFLGVGSIFAITPCTAEVCMEAVKRFRSAPVTILSLTSTQPMLPSLDADEYE